MSHRPHILFLTHRVPHPPNRGDRIRSWNILKFLAERAHVHLACLAEEPVSPESHQELGRHCERIEITPLSSMGRWLNAVWAFGTGRSATEGLFRSPKLQATVRQWIRETPFDAVLVFCSSMYQFAQGPPFSQVPVVVDLVDVDSEKWENYAETAPFWKRALYRMEARRVRRLETEIAHHAHAVTLVSQEEVQVFQRFCNVSNLSAIPNGVDLDYFHPVPPEGTREKNGGPFKLVFVGVLNYRANIEGLGWFCKEVWPQARKRIPQLELDIVGRHPGKAVRELANRPGVQLVGEVDDVRPYVWNADAVIAPLTIARGMQNKVLEALAMGQPVVATPEAAQGIGGLSGPQLLVGSQPAEWLNYLDDLANQPDLRHERGRQGRAAIEAEGSWPDRLAAFRPLLSSRGTVETPDAEVLAGGLLP